MTEMGHGRKGVERVAALGRDRGVGDRGAVEVDRHVVGEPAPDEDVAQKGPRSGGRTGMVWWPTSAHLPEVPDVPKYQTKSPIDQRREPTLASDQRLRGGIGAEAGCRCGPHRRSRRRRRRTATSPEARRTPVARPFSMRISSASASRRIPPPCPFTTPAMASAMAATRRWRNAPRTPSRDGRRGRTSR